MKTFLRKIFALTGFFLVATAASAQNFALDWFTLDSGGGTSTGGVFAVSGAITQPNADVMSGGNFTLNGEFLTLMAVTPASAVTTIFDNTSGEENGGIGATATTWLAGKFCLGSQPYALDSVSLLLNSQNGVGEPGLPSTVRLQIYSNDPVSGKPSASTGLIMNLSGLTNPITPPPRGFGLVKWTNATPFRLAANTCYWAVFSRESGGNIGQIVSFTKPTGDAGAFGVASSVNAGAMWGLLDTNSNFKMLIRGTASGTFQALAITAISFSGTELRFSFPANSGQSYVIESRPDLATGAWAEVPGTTRIGSGAALQLVLPVSMAQPQQFYRVKQLP